MMKKVFIFIFFLFFFLFLFLNFSFSSHVENINVEKCGYLLQIERANHFIEYGLSQGLDVTHISICQALNVIEDSKKNLENLNGRMEMAIQLDIEEENRRKEEEKNDVLIEIEDSTENYKKLQSIMDVLNIENIQEIPIELLKSLGLYNYTYDLLKKENIELNEQWAEEEILRNEEQERNEEIVENNEFELLDIENKDINTEVK